MRKVYLQLRLAEFCVVDVLCFQTGAKTKFSTRNIIGGGEERKRKMKEKCKNSETRMAPVLRQPSFLFLEFYCLFSSFV